MQRVYGYVRISTKKQNIERQIRNILAEYPTATIIREVYTGKSVSRPEFQKLLKMVQPDDTIVFDSVSRFSRNASEGVELYQDLFNKGVNLVFLKERHIDTATYRNELEKQLSFTVNTGDNATNDLLNSIIDSLNRYMMALAERQITLAFEQAQKEVDDLRQRTREGIETARRNGKQIGGHREGAKMKIKKEAPIKALIVKHSNDFEGNLKDNQVIAIINATGELHVSRNTYYKYKMRLRLEKDCI